jgi:hypothetical protein
MPDHDKEAQPQSNQQRNRVVVQMFYTSMDKRAKQIPRNPSKVLGKYHTFPD